MHLIPTKKVDKSPGNHLLYHHWKINLKNTSKLAVKIQIIATVGPHALNPSPLLIRGGFEAATKVAALSTAEIQQTLDAWPVDLDALPASVRAACDSWARLRLGPIDLAIRDLDADPNQGFTTPGGRFTKPLKCRALTVHGVAPPGGGPTPTPAELRSLLPATPDVVSEKLRSLEAQLLQQSSTIASLLRQQAAVDAERDVTADYEINALVLAEVPKSFVTLDPLSKKERRKTLREHQGVYPIDQWPNKLVLKQSTKQSKDMQNAKKLTLVEYAGEVSKFLERNDYSTKMAGTTWSRLLDMTADLSTNLENDPDSWYRADDILEQLDEIVHCAEGAFRFGLDMSGSMRLNVANRVDTAMGVSHLRVDPLKRETDDFISADTHKLIENEAKEKQNLLWAKQGHFPGSNAGRFFDKPSSKSSGGGGKHKSSGGGRGNYGNRPKKGKDGSGKGGGRGRGRGRGRGGGNHDKDKEGSSGD